MTETPNIDAWIADGIEMNKRHAKDSGLELTDRECVLVCLGQELMHITLDPSKDDLLVKICLRWLKEHV